jgi:hypothetical protein
VYDLTVRSAEIALEWSSSTCPGTRIAVVGTGRSSKAKAAYFNVVIDGVGFHALSAATPPMGPGGAVCLPPVCVQPAPAAGAIEVESLSDNRSNPVVNSLSPERRHTLLHTPGEPYVRREGVPGAGVALKEGGQHKISENVETMLQDQGAGAQGFSAAGNRSFEKNFVLLLLWSVMLVCFERVAQTTGRRRSWRSCGAAQRRLRRRRSRRGGGAARSRARTPSPHQCSQGGGMRRHAAYFQLGWTAARREGDFRSVPTKNAARHRNEGEGRADFVRGGEEVRASAGVKVLGVSRWVLMCIGETVQDNKRREH